MKADIEVYILYDFIFIAFQKQAKLVYGDRQVRNMDIFPDIIWVTFKTGSSD